MQSSAFRCPHTPGLQAQHKHFNTLLNELKLKSSQRGHPSSPLEYTHLHLVDSFFQSDDQRNREKIRVTRNDKTGEAIASMQKVRLGSLDIYSPKRSADWRISVNMEIPGTSGDTALTHVFGLILHTVPPPVGTPTLTRKKDRLSYSHEEFVVDLTQVTSSSGPNSKVSASHFLMSSSATHCSQPEILHELEVEIARPEYLLATANKRGDPNVSEVERNAFDELIRAFVNNARILVRNADGGWQ